jgi:hypothetical protein
MSQIGSSLHFSLFYLSPLLIVIWTGLKIYIHSCIRSTSTIFTFLPCFTIPLLLVTPSYCDLFFILVLCCLGVCSCLLELLPWYYTCTCIVIKSMQPLSTALPCPTTNLVLTVFSMFPCVLFLHRCDILNYYSLSFLLFFFHWCPLSVPLLDTCSVYISMHI